VATALKEGFRLEDKTDEVGKGVEIWVDAVRPETVYSQKEIFDAIESYREMVQGDERDWKLKDALAALHIDPSWLTDDFSLSVIQMFLFYRSNPHEAFAVPYTEQPAVWVQSVSVLQGIFPAI